MVFITPQPVHGSQPFAALYPSLVDVVILSPSVISLQNFVGVAYNLGFTNPARFLFFWFNKAINPAISGATALVPPNTNFCPSTKT